MSNNTTRIANLDHVVAWDDSEQRHVYLDNADLVFKGNEVVHVGPGHAEPVDTTIDGKGFMAIPGFVNELWFKVDAGKEGVYRGQCAAPQGFDQRGACGGPRRMRHRVPHPESQPLQ